MPKKQPENQSKDNQNQPENPPSESAQTDGSASQEDKSQNPPTSEDVSRDTTLAEPAAEGFGKGVDNMIVSVIGKDDVGEMPADILNDTGIQTQTGDHKPYDEDRFVELEATPDEIALDTFIHTYADRIEALVAEVRSVSRDARQRHMRTISQNAETTATKLNDMAVEFRKFIS